MDTPLFDDRALAKQRQQAAQQFSPWLFDEVAGRLVERLQDIRRSFTDILDLTPFHTGRLTPFLRDLYPDATLRTFPSDAAEEALDLTTFPPQSFDCILSALSVHWINYLPLHLQQLQQLLRPDGFLMLAFWGGATLNELRQSLYQAELALSGGGSPRVIPMISLEDGPSLLRQAGLVLPVLDQETWTLLYPDLNALIHHLRQMGETNALHARARNLAPRRLFAETEARYRNLYGPQGTLPATFQLLVFTGWAPASSQVKPLARGSATHSLADAL